MQKSGPQGGANSQMELDQIFQRTILEKKQLGPTYICRIHPQRKRMSLLYNFRRRDISFAYFPHKHVQ